MSILYNILGKPGRDNALLVKINSGKRFYRFLFDCGESVLSNTDQSDVKSLDYIFFSHCHIDHIAGFDYLFRRVYDRDKPVHVYGPEGITKIIFNRLNGFTWNLLHDAGGEWIIHEIKKDRIETSSIKASDAFSKIAPIETMKHDGCILSTGDFEITAVPLNHRIMTLGYFIMERETFNIDKDRLAQLGITAGEWLQKVKDENSNPDEVIYTGGRSYSILYLKELLLKNKKGESLAYLTDFIFDEYAKRASEIVAGADTIICESQYMHDDKELAETNYHLTSIQAAYLAGKSEAGKLVIFHISDRYKGDDFLTILEEAREVFPNTFFPGEWKI